MKNIVLLFCISISIAVNGQIYLEHSYPTNLKIDFNNTFPGDDGYMDFYLINGTNLELYDGQTHVLYKSMPLPASYTGNANNYLYFTDPEQPQYFISKHLFNNDDLIEFVSCVQYFNPFGNGISAPKIVISNEQGTILETIYDRYAPRLIKTADNTYKLLVSLGQGNVFSPIHGNYSQQIDVYALPGNLTLGQEEVYVWGKSYQGYPNPTSNKITISRQEPLTADTELEIFDLSGKRIQSQNVEAGTTDIIFDASELSSGVYLYRINGSIGKFIKK